MIYYRPTNFPTETVKGVLFHTFRILSDEVVEEQEEARISWERNTPMENLMFDLKALEYN